MVRSLSLTQQKSILSMLDSGHSGEDIAKKTGISSATISRLHSKECSTLPKAVGGHPSKLSPTNIHHAQHLISIDRAETAAQVTKALVRDMRALLISPNSKVILSQTGDTHRETDILLD